jgi:hypothetical protein
MLFLVGAVYRLHDHVRIVMGHDVRMVYEERLRTSAAAAAAAFGSSALLLSPSVRGGPPTVLFGVLETLFVAPLGTVALVFGAGAEPRVRP